MSLLLHSVSGPVRDWATESPAAGREEQDRSDGWHHHQPEAGQGAAAAGAHQEGWAHLWLPAGPASTRWGLSVEANETGILQVVQYRE